MSIFVDMEAPNTAEIIQAATAVCTVILGIAAIVQSWKVETLTQTNSRLAEAVTQLENQSKALSEQTEQLANQTKILLSNHQLQVSVTRRQRMPILIPPQRRIEFIETYPSLELKNWGTPVQHISAMVDNTEVVYPMKIGGREDEFWMIRFDSMPARIELNFSDFEQNSYTQIIIVQSDLSVLTTSAKLIVGGEVFEMEEFSSEEISEVLQIVKEMRSSNTIS